MRSRRRESGRTTIRDVARLADVSVASASRALNGLDNVTEATREKVLQAARQLRFVPHVGARSLSTRRTETIGLVLPDLHGEFFSELMRGIDAAARTRGLHLLVSSTHGDANEAASGIRSMRGRVDGLLVMSPYVDAIIISDNADRDFPIVLMNTDGAGSRLPSLRVDNYGGAFAVTKHLREIGRQRIAHISGPATNHEAQERLRGYIAALGAGAETRVVKGDFSEQSGNAGTHALFADGKGPDAIFAANDTMAVGALLALRELGKRVPEDVALAGFDDIPIARLVEPALTTVQISIADWGRRALERLANWIETGECDNTTETVEPTLVVRRSTSGATK
ncbi:MAG: LacI family DNA-binding transcriptional regulator [Terricaulis silvestris]